MSLSSCLDMSPRYVIRCSEMTCFFTTFATTLVDSDVKICCLLYLGMLDQVAHTWHKTYLVGSTIILGKLGCIVCSKILGICTAERNWKQIKAVKTGQRAALSAEKCKKCDSDEE